MSDTKFKVQYQDSNTIWMNVNGVEYDTYGEALEKLIEEAQADPQFSHRVVKLEVFGFINKGGHLG